MSFELMSINLYEFMRNNNFRSLSIGLIRRIAIQILNSLVFLKKNKIIHCDLKPENILLKHPSKSGIKVIDLGSSCFEDQRIYTYIQSRYYRAPEIMLGIPYTSAIDMWSFGCILAELYMGYPLFPGETELEQFSLIMSFKGLPPRHLLEKATRKNVFFDIKNMPILEKNSQGIVHLPNSTTFQEKIKPTDANFIKFLEVRSYFRNIGLH